MIFVDTGAWYASLVPTDRDHATAVQWLVTNHSPLLTTDYIIDETLTLLRARGEKNEHYC
jgi:predicted nucleic acid-binding protein